MFILPEPQKITIKSGFLKNRKFKVYNACEDKRIDSFLKNFEHSDEGSVLRIKAGNNDSEKYTLTIEENEVSIYGESAAGVFYALQTLKQIMTNEQITCVHIEDAPDMKYRGFYHDITRGKVPTLETLKKLVDSLAYYKMNSLQLYVEHTFPFKEFGDKVEEFGYLSAEEIKELDDYCYQNFIDLVPSIATFGHLYELLQLEEYKHLQVIDDYEQKNVFWRERMNHHTIDPLMPESIEIIKSMIDQYLPLFRSEKFNICCDETFDLVLGKHKDKDVFQIYIDFVNKIIAHIKSKGKKVMMWGDILLQHPDSISKLPKDTEFLNWCYSSEPDENTITTFENLGCIQIVCPGTGTWSRLIEAIDESGKNICKMLDYGFQHNAVGMLNTNWGDYGNPCSIELSMHGLILGAAKSWNRLTTTNEKFESAVNNLQYCNNNALKYMAALDECSKKIPWNEFALCYSNIIYGCGETKIPDKADIVNVIKECKKIIDILEIECWERDVYRRELLISAEGLLVMAELYAELAGYGLTRVSDTFKWLNKYRERWLESNKESELKKIEKMFITIEENLKEKSDCCE